MSFRLFTVWLLFTIITGTTSVAADNAWDCEQTQNGEWNCQKQSSAATSQPAAQQQTPAASSPAAATTGQQNVQAPPQTSPPTPAEAIPPQQNAQTPTVAVPTAPAQSERTENAVAVRSALAQQAPESEAAAAPAEQPQKPRVKVTQNQTPRLKKVEPVREVAKAVPAKQPGWTCQAATGEQAWNCNLVGPEPKGGTQVVAGSEEGWRLLSPSYSAAEENTFRILRSEFKEDPWLGCEDWSARKRKILPIAPVDRENAVTDVTADSSEAFEGEVLNFAGNVDLTRADQHMLADSASYDTAAGTMDAQGNVIYSEGSLALASETASMSLNTNEARLRKAIFINADTPIRGKSATIYRDNEYLSRYFDSSFTSCPPGNEDWVIHASRLKLNRESGQGAAKDSWLEFKGVPIFYTPYISFPTDNRRLSGFLSPTWGNTQLSGFYLSAPFYWNIAPNVDDTLTPRYFSSRGGMISNKFRYLTHSASGSFGVEYMPDDKILHKPRYSFSLQDNRTIAPGLTSAVNLNQVSDSLYFTDLNTALGFNRSSFLPSTANLNYGRKDMFFSASFIHYQKVDPTILPAGVPYTVLPRLTMNLEHEFENIPLKLQMDNQFSDFEHPVLVSGQRLVLWPAVSMPLESESGFLIPKVSVQSTQYQLSNQSVASYQLVGQTYTGQPSSINRTLPIVSLDSGLFFEKPMKFDGTPYTNILEPRLFYLYIPRKNQSDIPIFDTTAYDTNFNSLFRENSYAGYDRLQDANQLTVAATSRYLNTRTGLEPLKASFGTILYFQNRIVTLPGVPVQTSKTSNYIAELSGQLTSHLSYTGGAQWNTEENQLGRGQAVLQFRDQPNRIFDIGYRYRSATANPLVLPTFIPGTLGTVPIPANISLADVSFRWPLFDQWTILGRMQYSLNFNKTMESFLGLEKESCCWRLRVIARRFVNGATTNNYVASNVAPQTAFFLELDLKGLSGLGNDVDTFLQTNLNGYHPASFFK